MNSFQHATTGHRAAFVVMAVLLLQACTMGGQMLKEADSSSIIADNEIIVVGTIELIPALGKEEQELSPSGVIDLAGYGGMNRNRAMIQFNNQPEASDYKFLINPKLDEMFFFKIPADLKYVVDGRVIVELGRRGAVSEILLPTGLKIDARPGDKAVYIGNLKFTRDDFNSITGVKLTDEYKSAVRQFRTRFGGKYKLRKAIVKPMPPRSG